MGVVYNISSIVDFCQRFLSLLSYQFREFSPSLALSLLQSAKVSDSKVETTPLTYDELRALYNQYDLKRLELYSRNMADHHLITDLLPGRKERGGGVIICCYFVAP